MKKIGIQLMTLREKIAKEGIYQVLKNLNNMGYHIFELSFVPMTEENINEVVRAIDELGIEIAAISANVEANNPNVETLENNFDKIVADCKRMKCKILRVGIMPFDYMDDEKKALEFTNKCDNIAKNLNEVGIKFLFHGHHNEFTKFDDKYFIETMRDRTKYLGFELDTHWIQRGGETPHEYIENFKGRMPVLHLKDYSIYPPNFSKIKEEDRNLGNKEMTSTFFELVRYAPVGEGSLKFNRIIDNALEQGVEYFFIEQDDTYGEDAYECVQKSYNNLVKMGYKELI